ncbi:MAG: aldo/keto reductase [Candidatus Hadarchaeota archaeon]
MAYIDISPEGVPRLDDMPQLGLGTWQNTDPQQCAESVRKALEMGYRHVDTAQAYGNESPVGKGISEAEVPRDEVFLATKIDIKNLSYDDVLRTAEESMEKLDVEYIDLLYVHWPAHSYDPEDTLPAFNELQDDGKIRYVGVSNFTQDHVREAEEVLESEIFANQIEMHPLLYQEEMLEHSRESGYHIVAYSPLARGRIFDVPEVSEIAEKHDASEAQVSLAWIREKGAAAIPKGTTENHIGDNLESILLDLDEEDIEKIDSIERKERLIDPSFSPNSW